MFRFSCIFLLPLSLHFLIFPRSAQVTSTTVSSGRSARLKIGGSARAPSASSRRLRATTPGSARCIGKNPHTPVVLLSLKSLGYLLHWDLPSMKRCAPLV
ncbi:unnamed protein product, partial [Ectocarpus fasciculatus]